MAVLPSLLLLGVTFAPTIAFLVIALVSLKGTRPSDRPAILCALSTLYQCCGRRSSSR